MTKKMFWKIVVLWYNPLTSFQIIKTVLCGVYACIWLSTHITGQVKYGRDARRPDNLDHHETSPVPGRLSIGDVCSWSFEIVLNAKIEEWPRALRRRKTANLLAFVLTVFELSSLSRIICSLKIQMCLCLGFFWRNASEILNTLWRVPPGPPSKTLSLFNSGWLSYSRPKWPDSSLRSWQVLCSHSSRLNGI